MKCANGHDVPDGQAFCGEDGTPVPQATIQKSVCSTCNCEGTGTYCGNCGEPLIKSAEASEAEYNEVLGTLDEIVKGTTALPVDLEVEHDPTDAGEAGVDLLAKGFDGDPDGDPGQVDAGPLVEALLKGHNYVIDNLVALGREMRATRRENGLLAKSVAFLTRRNKELATQIGGFANQPAGPKAQLGPARRAAVTPITKGLGPDGGGGPIAAGDGSLCGPELMRHGRVALMKGRIDSDDLIRLEAWTENTKNPQHPQGASLAMIKAQDSALGTKLEDAFAAA